MTDEQWTSHDGSKRIPVDEDATVWVKLKSGYRAHLPHPAHYIHNWERVEKYRRA